MAVSNEAPTFRHEALAVVFKITGDELTVLAWRRSRAPFTGAWALPSGPVEADETLGSCIARHLATKVDLGELAHLEQLETRSDPERDPFQRTIATAYLGLVPSTAEPDLPDNAGWVRANDPPTMAFDHASVINSAIERMRSKISYSNLAFGLAPEEFTIAELRRLYEVALGYEVSPTNLNRVLQRRAQIESTGKTASPGGSGGRPATLHRFTHRRLQITDPFAVLRPND